MDAVVVERCQQSKEVVNIHSCGSLITIVRLLKHLFYDLLDIRKRVWDHLILHG